MSQQSDSNKNNPGAGFKGFAAKRIIIAIGLIILVIWAFSFAPGTKGPAPTKGDGDAAIEKQANLADSTEHDAANQITDHDETQQLAAHDASKETADHEASQQPTADDESQQGPQLKPAEHPVKKSPQPPLHISVTDRDASPAEGPSPETDPHSEPNAAKHHEKISHTDTAGEDAPADEIQAPAEENAHGGMAVEKDQRGSEKSHGDTPQTGHGDLPVGVAFVDATIASIDHELNGRFWGWRPNDIIYFTDNTTNLQLGVLEVTRRTVVSLTERISRTGTTDTLNPNLENAMNWLMVKATSYWFPAPETKYNESIELLKAFKDELKNGHASFYTRADNLIPLLSSYEDLLGSCDENLVRQTNEEGTRVSTFKADDYFYYAQGVASSMVKVLEAIEHDFHDTLENRRATELLHHAIESCRQAAELDPLFITNGDLDGIFANHRANMAAPISHARFYISQLIKTLST